MIDLYIFRVHIAVVVDCQRKANGRRIAVNLRLINGSGKAQVQYVLGVHGRHGYSIGSGRHLVAGSVHRRHIELVLGRFLNGNVLRQSQRITGLQFLIGENLSQRIISYANIAEIDVSLVIQRQRQRHRAIHHSALGAGGKGGSQLGIPIGDLLVVDCIGQLLGASLGGIRQFRTAGQVFFAHLDCKGQFRRLAGLQREGIDGLFLFLNIGIFLNFNVIEGQGTGVGDKICHLHILILLGYRRRNGSLDLQQHIGLLRRDLCLNGNALFHALAAGQIVGILQIINDRAVIQGTLADVIFARPSQRLAGLQGRLTAVAEIRDHLCGGIQQRDRVFQVLIGSIGYGDRDINLSGRCQIGRIQLNRSHHRRGGSAGDSAD